MTKRVYLTVAVDMPDSASNELTKAKALRTLRDNFLGYTVEVYYGKQMEHQDVLSFDRKFGVPNAIMPSWLDPVALSFRIKFMQEELNEFVDACNELDMEKAADSLVDLAWVTHGTATMMGLPWSMLWHEVVRANMSKERASGADDPRSVRKNSIDIVKPLGWKAPDHAMALGRRHSFPTLHTGAESKAAPLHAQKPEATETMVGMNLADAEVQVAAMVAEAEDSTQGVRIDQGSFWPTADTPALSGGGSFDGAGASADFTVDASPSSTDVGGDL